jgi:Glycosyl hydrolase family 10
MSTLPPGPGRPCHRADRAIRGRQFEIFRLDSDPSGIDPNNFWIAALGPDIIPRAFRWAHEADPHALLFYNDYNIAGQDGTNAKSDAVYVWLQEQLAAGVPIMGIGNQGHLDTRYGFSGALFQADLERYATTGVKVAITEADVRTFVNNPADQVPTDSLAVFAQPYEYSQMLKAALAVPDVISFTVWGFTDSDSWVPGTFPGRGVRRDLRREPAAEKRLLRAAVRSAAGRLRRPLPGAERRRLLTRRAAASRRRPAGGMPAGGMQAETAGRPAAGRPAGGRSSRQRGQRTPYRCSIASWSRCS